MDPKDTSDTKFSPPEVGEVLTSFTRQVYGLASALPVTGLFLQVSHEAAIDDHNDYLDKFGVPDGEAFIIPPEYADEYNRIKKELEGSSTASEIVRRSFIVSLVSVFDSLLGRLIRALYAIKPELMNSSDRSMTFAQLIDFPDVESAREFLLEKEVESVLRESHAEQFKWLEQKFSIVLRKDLPSWPEFIELTERRNLFVHTDGAVSSQYIKICKEQDVNLDPAIRVGVKLGVTKEYFDRAHECLFEIGVKLGQVLWRKIAPLELASADHNLNVICYELLAEERYSLAINLLDFATCILKKHENDYVRRALIINRAQAYKWSKQMDKALNILAGEDWSAANDVFKLCIAVLKDDYETAAQIMRLIGSNPQTKVHYKDWPVFKEFRRCEAFKGAYNEIFGQPFSVAERHGEGNMAFLVSRDGKVRSALKRVALPKTTGEPQ